MMVSRDMHSTSNLSTASVVRIGLVLRWPAEGVSAVRSEFEGWTEVRLAADPQTEP